MHGNCTAIHLKELPPGLSCVSYVFAYAHMYVHIMMYAFMLYVDRIMEKNNYGKKKNYGKTSAADHLIFLFFSPDKICWKKSFFP